MIVVSNNARLAMLSKIGASQDTGEIKLFTSDVPLTPDTNPDDLAEPTFPGYVAHGLPLSETVHFDPVRGLHYLEWPEITYTRTTTGTAQTVRGYRVRTDDYDPGWFERFATPITLTFAGDAFRLRPRFYLWSVPSHF